MLGGTVDLNGTNGRGLSIGDRTDPAAQANHTNNGTTNVAGDGSIGIRAGDGWNSGSGASIQSDVRNAETINVSGENAFGIRVGDEANTNGNHNSFGTGPTPGSPTGGSRSREPTASSASPTSARSPATSSSREETIFSSTEPRGASWARSSSAPATTPPA